MDSVQDTNVQCYVSSIEIEGLWGRADVVKIDFDPTINILIGENASGKTTILSLIRCVLQVDVLGLMDVHFKQVTLKMVSFEGASIRTIRIVPEKRGFSYFISGRKFVIPVDAYMVDRFSTRIVRQKVAERKREVFKQLQGVAKIVWLPVARRLPISDEEPDERYTSSRGRPIESVDHRLAELMAELVRYRLGLNDLVAREYKKFERNILSLMLFDKSHDQFKIANINKHELTPEDRLQLIKAFSAADLLTSQNQRKIDEHFGEAEKTVKNLREKGAGSGFTVREVLMFPLLSRTKALAELARELEQRRKEIFDPVNRFVDVANSFLSSKIISVDVVGKLIFSSSSNPELKYLASSLSSGEKQVLILLIQALVSEPEPCIFIADEPELSLHVNWQEKLLPSMLSLAGSMQLIVATHSPDIAGPYPEKVIDISRDSHE